MKNVPALHLVDRDEVTEPPEFSDELRLALADVAGAAREGLLAMSVAVGLRVMAEMMESEVTAKVGAKHAKMPDRAARRHGSEDGSVVLGGRRVAVRRPRARTTAGEEVGLESNATFAADDLLGQVVLDACWPASPPAATAPLTSRWARPSRRAPPRHRARRCRGASWPRRPRRSTS